MRDRVAASNQRSRRTTCAASRLRRFDYQLVHADSPGAAAISCQARERVKRPFRLSSLEAILGRQSARPNRECRNLELDGKRRETVSDGL